MACPSSHLPYLVSSQTGNCYDRYCLSKILDGVGRLTLAGFTQHLGAFAFSDFELKTKTDNTPISEEELKRISALQKLEASIADISLRSLRSSAHAFGP